MTLRVHVCPVGFELDRLLLPLVEYKADRVYLFTRESGRENAPFFYDSIVEKLDGFGIEHRTIRCDMEDLLDVLQKLTRVFQREMEDGNRVHVNVSSGNKVAAIAGTMACMIWGGTPYFVKASEYAPAPFEPLSKGMVEVNELPPYKIDRPTPIMLETLRMLSTRGGSGRKKDVIRHLKDQGFILIKDGDGGGRNRIIAEYRKFDSMVMDDLLEWDLVTVTGRTRGLRINITENGENALRIFAGEGSG